jgi:hypothetical protein
VKRWYATQYDELGRLRQRLVVGNLRLIIWRRLPRLSIIETLVLGVIGLVVAIDRFDITRGI